MHPYWESVKTFHGIWMITSSHSSVAHLKKLSTLHTLHDHVEETFVLADEAILFKKIKLNLSWVGCSKNKVAVFKF